MEQHPVPQNITTFQFRLIGDMTIKQFGYLGGGIALAFIAYKLPLPFFFTWPLAAVCALGGFGFAFVPIEERPMDIWFFSFLKNVYNPTVFHWERTAPTAEPPKTVVPPPPKIPTFSLDAFRIPGMTKKPTPQQPTTPLTTAPTQNTPPLATFVGAVSQKTPPPSQTPKSSPSPLDAFFFWIDNLFTPTPNVAIAGASRSNIPSHTPISHPAPKPVSLPKSQPTPQAIPRVPLAYTTPSVVGRRAAPMPPATPQPSPQQPPSDTAKIARETQALKTQLDSLQKELQNRSLENARVSEMQQQMTDLLKQRESMEKELIALRTKAQDAPKPPPVYKKAGVVPTPHQKEEPTVKMMGQEAATRAGLPRLTTFPNVVTGIIKDNENTLLPGVLVTVKDHDGVPLRALKTNKLGQFAASTPLTNGTYIVEVEDPRSRFTFDKVQITLNGAVMPAIQIVAKSKKELEREELSRQIFGTPNASA